MSTAQESAETVGKPCLKKKKPQGFEKTNDNVSVDPNSEMLCSVKGRLVKKQRRDCPMIQNLGE